MTQLLLCPHMFSFCKILFAAVGRFTDVSSWCLSEFLTFLFFFWYISKMFSFFVNFDFQCKYFCLPCSPCEPGIAFHRCHTFSSSCLFFLVAQCHFPPPRNNKSPFVERHFQHWHTRHHGVCDLPLFWSHLCSHWSHFKYFILAFSLATCKTRAPTKLWVAWRGSLLRIMWLQVWTDSLMVSHVSITRHSPARMRKNVLHVNAFPTHLDICWKSCTADAFIIIISSQVVLPQPQHQFVDQLQMSVLEMAKKRLNSFWSMPE